MKLVLLPGMDGTGELFREFVELYEGKTQIIGFPEEGDQSFEHLSAVIKNQLPNGDFILLAESFSGGIVEHLLNAEGLKGIIFVASFISAPNKAMLTLASLMPKKLMTYLPGSKFVTKLLFLGQGAEENAYQDFVGVIRRIPSKRLNKRLSSIKTLCYSGPNKVALPCVYIRSNQDLLVSDKKLKQIESVFENFNSYFLDGPHFILQSKPKQTAELVKRAVDHIKNYNV